MGIVWGMALGLVARWRGIGGSAALLIGALVVSHWVLDFVTHVPDLPLWPGPSPRVGLGLWNSIPGTLIVESALWIGGIAICLRTLPLRGALPAVAFWSLVAVSMLLWAISPWSPPPPSAAAVGWFGLIGWVTIPWAAAADRRPSATSPPPAS